MFCWLLLCARCYARSGGYKGCKAGLSAYSPGLRIPRGGDKSQLPLTHIHSSPPVTAMKKGSQRSGGMCGVGKPWLGGTSKLLTQLPRLQRGLMMPAPCSWGGVWLKELVQAKTQAWRVLAGKVTILSWRVAVTLSSIPPSIDPADILQFGTSSN